MNTLRPSADLLFAIASFSPGIVWLSFFFAPRHHYTRLAADLLITILAALYCLTLIPDLTSLIPMIANPTLPNIQTLLTSPYGTAVGWTHFVIADVWMGKWITLDSVKLGFKFWIRIPVLFVTVLFGPLGFVLYLILRTIKTKKSPIPLNT